MPSADPLGDSHRDPQGDPQFDPQGDPHGDLYDDPNDEEQEEPWPALAPRRGERMVTMRVRGSWGVACEDGDEGDWGGDGAMPDAWAARDREATEPRTPRSVPGSPRAAAAALRHMHLYHEDVVFRARDIVAAMAAATERDADRAASDGEEVVDPSSDGPRAWGAEAGAVQVGDSERDDPDAEREREQSEEEQQQEQEQEQEAELDEVAGQQRQLRAAVAAGCGLHRAFSHPSLALLAGGHSVWWPSRTSRVRRLVRRGRAASSGPSEVERWSEPGGEGDSGEARSSSDEAGPGAARGGLAPQGVGIGGAIVSSRAALPVGLGCVASQRLLPEWRALAGVALEDRVITGLAAGAHLLAFRLAVEDPEAGTASAAAALQTLRTSASRGGQRAGVGLVCLPANALAAQGLSVPLAAAFARAPVGSIPKSVGLYASGELLRGGVESDVVELTPPGRSGLARPGPDSGKRAVSPPSPPPGHSSGEDGAGDGCGDGSGAGNSVGSDGGSGSSGGLAAADPTTAATAAPGAAAAAAAAAPSVGVAADGSQPGAAEGAAFAPGDLVCMIVLPVVAAAARFKDDMPLSPTLSGRGSERFLSLSVCFFLPGNPSLGVVPAGRLTLGPGELLFATASLSRPASDARAGVALRLDAVLTHTEALDAGLMRRGRRGGPLQPAPQTLAAVKEASRLCREDLPPVLWTLDGEACPLC